MKYTIFEHISNLTERKLLSDNYDDDAWKSFSPYMINQWLSMDKDLIEFVNYLQRFTIGVLSSEQVYRLYLGFLPEKKFYIKYIKGSKASKYNTDLVAYISKYHGTSTKNGIGYLNIYYNTSSGIDTIKSILSKYGLTKKEIIKMLKIK